MSGKQGRSQAEMTDGTRGPRWRALLEARWQDRARALTGYTPR